MLAFAASLTLAVLRIPDEERHAVHRNHPQETRRARAVPGRDRFLRRGACRRQPARRAGIGVGHGDRDQLHDARRGKPPDERHGTERDGARLVRARSTRSGRRQAFDRRRRRQGELRAGSDCRGVRLLRADGLRPRPGTHWRHARQDRQHPRLQRDAGPRALQKGGEGYRLRHHRPDGQARTRRQTLLCRQGRHRHGRIESRRGR